MNVADDISLRTINYFTAVEIVCKLCKFQFGGPLTLKAGLSFWDPPSEEVRRPLGDEFSLNYDTRGVGGGDDKLDARWRELAVPGGARSGGLV